MKQLSEVQRDTTATLSVESVPQRLAFRFRCRECETETDHRYVLSGPDRIIVQCLACAETCCVFERSVESAPPAPPTGWQPRRYDVVVDGDNQIYEQPETGRFVKWSDIEHLLPPAPLAANGEK